jgi:hypothetical protein
MNVIGSTCNLALELHALQCRRDAWCVWTEHTQDNNTGLTGTMIPIFPVSEQLQQTAFGSVDLR